MLKRKWLRNVLRGLLVVVVIAVAVYGLFVVISQPMPDHAFFLTDDDVLVIAHQGGDGLRPGNTMAAFEHAAGLGVDVLEMDIHITSDGEIVVIHDDTVDRTTDGTGRVNDMTFADIQALDAGYDWFPTGTQGEGMPPYRGEGIQIPALEDVLTAFPDYRYNIEIKQREPSMVSATCDLLREYEMADRALIASFHQETIVEFRETCPEFATSGVEGEIAVFFGLNTLGLSRAWQPGMHAFQVPERFGSFQVITPGFVSGANHHNVDVHVWTINDGDDMDRMIAAGVDGIITDYPDVLLTKLGRGEDTSAEG